MQRAEADSMRVGFCVYWAFGRNAGWSATAVRGEDPTKKIGAAMNNNAQVMSLGV